MINLYITRHGETNWNVQKKVMGRCDEVLNQKGIEQARELKKRLKDINFDLIIASPLLRARETANIINEDRGIDTIYDERLLERDFGEFEGLTKDEFDFNGFWDYKSNNQYKQAETVKECIKRVYDFLDELKEKYQGKDILIVSHGGISAVIISYFIGFNKGALASDEYNLHNCEIKNYIVN